MTLKRAIIIVVLAGIIFSGIGGAVGWMLGTYSPEYYLMIFQREHDPDFDPVQMGLSLGLMQGMIAGVVIAALVIGMLIWRDSFHQRLEEDEDIGYVSASRSRYWWWSVYGILMMCFPLMCCSGVSLFLGVLMGQQQLYQRETFHKLDKLDEILDGGRYPDVYTEYSSAAQVYLRGSVKDQATYDSLRNELVLEFGTEEADDMLRIVDVRNQE